MTRKRKLVLNTIISLLYQMITLICGFILPHLLLNCYGSETNGLVSSVTQFLGFISLAECGVGAVVQSALYKPLAEKDGNEISRIIISSERFFRKIAMILLVYTSFLMIVYPMITLDSFGYFYTFSLILVIAISSFAQYYFSMSYRLLLNADQMAFVQLGLQAAILILNTAFSVLLMENGAGIQTVKLVSSLLFLIQPAALTVFVRKYYKLNKALALHTEPIKQKWNGLAQHIAAVILNNTDTAVLTLFSTLENVSIYAVYNLVTNGVKQILLSLTAGIQPMLGNMYAKGESETLNKTFSYMEWLVHTAVVFVFACTGLLIVSFIQVYTKGITDANYDVPVFAYMLVGAQASYCLRLPYNMMVLAAGHYRQTQASAVAEALANIVLSVLLVVKFGITGVAMGTLAAMLYRTGYLAWYLSGNILCRRLSHFLKHIVVDVISVVVIVVGTSWVTLENLSYLSWIYDAVQIAAVCTGVLFGINVVFYRAYVIKLYREIINGVVLMKKGTVVMLKKLGGG